MININIVEFSGTDISHNDFKILAENKIYCGRCSRRCGLNRGNLPE